MNKTMSSESKETLAELRRLVRENDRALKAAGVILETPYYRQIKNILGIGVRRQSPPPIDEYNAAAVDIIRSLKKYPA